MRIVSRFHDYYDQGMGHGQDQSILYIRKTEPLSKEKAIPYINLANGNLGGGSLDKTGKEFSVSLHRRLLFFCGRSVQFVEAQFCAVRYPYECDEPVFIYTWEALKSLFHAKGIDHWDVNSGYKHSKWLSNNYPLNNVKKWLSMSQVSSSLYNLMLKDRLSVLQVTYEGGEWVVYKDPILRKFQFIRRFQPFEAYQELSMWIGGVLPGQDADMAVVGDKDRMSQHGFDKWSFKKMPSKKRK
jgi:hypothetical protein